MNVLFKLHPKQHDVFKDQARFVLVAAGRRFGKTRLAIVKIIIIASEIPKSNIWYVAPQYNQAKDIAWAMLLELLPSQAILKKINQTI